MRRVLWKERERDLKVRLQFGPILAILGTVLCVCPLARAQRGSRALIGARSTSSAAVSSSKGSTRGATVSRANVRISSASGFAHSTQQQSILSPINRHKPSPIPNPPPRTTAGTNGYYLLSGGGTYWVPANSDESADQASVDQANDDEAGGDQSFDQSGRNQSQRAEAVTLQTQDAQSGEEDSYAQQSAEEHETQAPLPDEGEFTLVLTDGRWIQAVAFTHADDSIVYITGAGSRYTIPANELDSDSTLRVNQERGTPLQSPL
jgi:hypothetical protein